MSSKPTILFVPGAWHTSEAFDPVANLLTAAGYGYKGLHLPSVTSDGPYVQGTGEDVKLISDTVLELADAGKDVVVVMHSYGGVPGSCAAKGLSKEDRTKEGKQGGIAALVYMTAFALEEGVSLIAAFGGSLSPWITIHGEDTYMTAGNSNEVFYNDVPTEEADKWTAKLNKHATKTFWDPVTYAAWRFIPSTYIICEADNAIPDFAQEGMAKQDGKFKIERLEGTSHSPFLSKPKETAEIIRRAAGEAV